MNLRIPLLFVLNYALHIILVTGHKSFNYPLVIIFIAALYFPVYLALVFLLERGAAWLAGQKHDLATLLVDQAKFQLVLIGTPDFRRFLVDHLFPPEARGSDAAYWFTITFSFVFVVVFVYGLCEVLYKVARSVQ